jgi:hypothetical protein
LSANRDEFRGERGFVGPRGAPGSIDAATHNAVQAVEERFAELEKKLMARVAKKEQS